MPDEDEKKFEAASRENKLFRHYFDLMMTGAIGASRELGPDAVIDRVEVLARRAAARMIRADQAWEEQRRSYANQRIQRAREGREAEHVPGMDLSRVSRHDCK